MSESANHPDFDAAPADERWSRSLGELSTFLRQQAWRRRGEWVRIVLPHGALVAMRVDPAAFRKELCIGRSAAPTDDKGRAARATEIETFRRYLGCEAWTLTSDDGRRVVLVETFTTNEQGEHGGPLCARCRAPCEKGPFRVPLCNRCALQAGQEEIAQRQGGPP